MSYEIILETELYTLVRGRHGLFLANPHDRFIGRALIEYGEFSERQWQVFKRFTHKNDVVIDVGANIGGHTVSFAKQVGIGGAVWAYEPQPAVFQNLCANISLNALMNVKTFNAGCGAQDDEINIPHINYSRDYNYGSISLEEMEEENKRLGDAAAWQNIPVLKLDDHFNGDRLDFIKIDVEGMEIDVLQGAKNIITTFKPVLYVENDREDKSEELVSFILDCGYDAWWDRPMLFNPDNYANRLDNVLGNFRTTNMLCIHPDSDKSHNLDPQRKIKTPQDRP